MSGSLLRDAVRLFRTLRWLRPVQVFGRLWFRLYRPRPYAGPAPEQRALTSPWRGCARPATMLAAGRFRFLGVERDVATASDWNAGAVPRLWLYNLHYFDDLNADGAVTRQAWHRDLLARWLRDNPPQRGCGWEPYPTSLRIVNWTQWAWAGNGLDAGLRQSLAAQAHCLRRRLEVHLQGNHLWANAKALVFAGCFFEGAMADEWRRQGLALLRRELAEQLLPDGGHFERSPMYHAIILADVLDLLQLAEKFPALFDPRDVHAWRGTAPRMLRWLQVMSHPDGEIALFNDAAFGVAATPGALREYAQALGLAPEAPLADCEVLAASGYVRLQAGAAVLIADVGEIGPDYLPGHAHADTLSFELSLGGRRVLVNGGTSTYEADAERLRQRGTAAHNAVLVNGEDSSEVWSSFRVARRARPSAVECGRDGDSRFLLAAHDGYRRLPGIGLTHRRWRLDAHSLWIEDRVEGGCVQAVAHYHLHPDCRIAAIAADGGDIEAGDIRLRLSADNAASLVVRDARWNPRFGESVGNRCFEVGLAAGVAQVRLEWD